MGPEGATGVKTSAYGKWWTLVDEGMRARQSRMGYLNRHKRSVRKRWEDIRRSGRGIYRYSMRLVSRLSGIVLNVGLRGLHFIRVIQYP